MPGTSYRQLAERYDELFQPSRAPIDAARRRVLRHVLPAVRTACDLGCGTGTTALALAGAGIRAYAVDASPVMCRIARRKSRAARASVRVIHGDMRGFRLPEAVDLVTCECDALNHIPRRADLRAVTRAVAGALRPGGHFYFDVNNAAGFRRYWSGTVWLERAGAVLFMRNGHDRRATRAWSEIELYVREGSLWRRHRDRVDEVSWTQAEIRGALRASGFDAVRAWDSAPFFGPDSPVRPGCRTIYLARKAEP